MSPDDFETAKAKQFLVEHVFAQVRVFKCREEKTCRDRPGHKKAMNCSPYEATHAELVEREVGVLRR